VVRLGEPGAELWLREELLHPGRLLRYGLQQQCRRRISGRGVHGAIGDRIFISDRAALRLEARAYYAPNTQLPGGTWGGQVVGTAGLSVFLGPSHQEAAYPEVPKEKRDSIVAAGGKVPRRGPGRSELRTTRG